MVSLKEYENKQQGFTVLYGGQPVGVIEYKDFWKGMPYLSLLKLSPDYRRRGIGAQAMKLFEEVIKERGNKAIILSTQSDEEGQFFYRKIGYKECGCLILEDTPFNQPMEMFFIKTL